MIGRDYSMYGAIIGDICGSIYEYEKFKTDNPGEIPLIDSRCFYTDDTVLTCATIDALLKKRNYKKAAYRWANDYPGRGYGKKFVLWCTSLFPRPYNSFGNGSAMRVSGIGWAFETIEETLSEAKRSSEITHNHPEGIKGAEATAAAIFLAREGNNKEIIKKCIEDTFGYNLQRTLKDIRPNYTYDLSCQGTVPEAIIAFLESNDFTGAIQNAISLGGDSDTLACITGGIAEAYYKKIPEELITFANRALCKDMVKLLEKFYQEYDIVTEFF